MSVAPLPPVEERTVAHVLERWARDRPDAVALSDTESSWTYGEVWDRARRVATSLRSLVDSAHGRVLLMLDNHADTALTWAGAAIGGLVEVPVNTAYRGDVLVHQMNDCEATVILVEDHYLERIVAVLPQLEHLRHIVVRGDAPDEVPTGAQVIAFDSLQSGGGEDGDADLPPVVGSDPVAIMYTSGTTGVSKGVLVSHAHAYTYGAPALLGGAERDDTELVVLPLFHVGGQWAGLYNAWIAGARAHVAARFDGQGFWDLAREHGCTYALIVGTMANFLMQQPARDDDGDNPFRRLFVAPVPEGIGDFAERFDVEVVTGYGSTEAGTVLVAGVGDATPHVCGRPPDTVEVRLVDPSDVDVPDGEVGELVVRPTEPWITMQEYVGRSDATVASWRNLWYHTGDAMYRDRDGRYVFVDRLGDAIRRRGENIPSASVEGAIQEHPDVLECAVVGVPGEIEHEVLAIVVPQPGSTIDPADLIRVLAGRLPHFMVPRYLEVVDELERTPSGKVRKRMLRERGVGTDTWDREAAGIRVTRRGVEELVADG